MKLYLLTPSGIPENPHLFPMWKDNWIKQGCQIVNSIQEAEIVMFDFHTRVADYDQRDIDYLLQSVLPVITFDEWDRGNLSTDEWPYPLTPQQESVFLYSHTVKSVHFCRLLDKTKTYPFNVYPYEKAIMYEENEVSKENLFNREYDVCFIANIALSREAIAEALIKDGRLKCYISLGAKKIPFTEFVNQHKKAKLFISSGAGGYTDERCQSLFSIAGIVRERSNQLLLHDFNHTWNCLRIDSPPTKQDLDDIVRAVNDKEHLWDIYTNGIDLMKDYYSPEYTTSYIFDTIKKHIQ